MASEDGKVEVFFFPFIVRGHVIPMVETAKLFAAQGARVTIITTPDDAQLFQKNTQGLDINFHTFDLPEGWEKTVFMDVSEEIFMEKLLREPIEQLLEERRPDCLVSDMFYPWTVPPCDRLGIASILLCVTGLFPRCCEEVVRRHAPHEKVDSDVATFVLPGLPNRDLKFTRPKMQCYGGGPVFKIIAEAELKSYGVIFNSFYELEQAYAEYFKTDLGRKLWLVGPLHLFSKCNEEKAERGQKNSIGGATVLNWLDSKQPKSVLYVSFGTLTSMAPGQFFELAQGLEASGHPFIWVARNMPESVLPEGFEERMTESGKGLIVRSWAPQLLILEHPAVGGFLTHCGWNSTVEGIGAGLPMITWPISFEQFYIESLITDVLKTGIRVGNEEWMSLHWEPKVTVTSEKVEKAVKRLMGGGDEVEEMRRRARDLSVKAKKAVEPGGSSLADVFALINDLKSRRSTRVKKC